MSRKVFLNETGFFLFFIMIFLFVSCQNKPTKVIEESVQIFKKNTVLIDTRSPLMFESFHIEGSQNLWWEDFVLLKNPKTKKRVFDPDLKQTIDRLAKKGIHPDMTIYLISEKADSTENKKWKWLLSYLEVRNVELKAIADLRKSKSGSINRFALATPQKPWSLLTSDDFQKDLIEKKIPLCFMKWDEKKCF